MAIPENVAVQKMDNFLFLHRSPTHETKNLFDTLKGAITSLRHIKDVFYLVGLIFNPDLFCNEYHRISL